MSRETLIYHAGDAISAGAIFGVAMGYLSDVAVLLPFIWYGLQIYDWFERRTKKKDGKKD